MAKHKDRKQKDYKAIYEIFKKVNQEDLITLYENYSGEELDRELLASNNPHVNLALEVTLVMAISDGITWDELEETLKEALK